MCISVSRSDVKAISTIAFTVSVIVLLVIGILGLCHVIPMAASTATAFVAFSAGVI